MPTSDPDYTPSSVTRRPPRRTVSARAVKPYDPSTDGSDDDAPTTSPRNAKRQKNGCLTCRVRRKKCSDESQGEVPNKPCSACSRLDIECLGWAHKRPKWLQNQKTLEKVKGAIQEHTNNTPKNSDAPKAPLSLSQFYSKHAWEAPFPIQSSASPQSQSSLPSLSSPSDSSLRLSSPDDEDTDYHHTSELIQSTSPAATIQFPTGLETFTREPVIVSNESATEAPKAVTDYLTLWPFALPMENRTDFGLDAFSGQTVDGADHGGVDPADLPVLYNGNGEMGGSVALSTFLSFLDPSSFVEDPNAGGFALNPFFQSGLYDTNAQDATTSAATSPFSDDSLQASIDLPAGAPQFLMPMQLSFPQLPLNPRGYQILKRWADEVAPFMYRFVQKSELNGGFAFAELVYGGGCEDPETFDATAALLRLRTLSLEDVAPLPSTQSQDERARIAYSLDDLAQRLRNRALTDPAHTGNAVTALFAISASLFLGGSTGWKSCLEDSCRWVSAIWPIFSQNLSTINPAVKLLVGITAWFDVLGAVTLRRTPMLGITILSEILADDSTIQLRNIMGCENRVMLSIAHIAQLASLMRDQSLGMPGATPWSTAQTLTYVEFIESLLSAPTSSPAQYGPPSPPSFASSSTTSGGIVRWAHSVPPSTHITAAFQAAARVYLATTAYGSSVSGTVNPSVDIVIAPNVAAQHISNVLKDAVSDLQAIPASDADRSMVFPLCLIGSAVPVHQGMDRMWFVQRFASMDGKERLGNGAFAEAVMKTTWRIRDAQIRAAAVHGHFPILSDWIDCMGDAPLLLA